MSAGLKLKGDQFGGAEYLRHTWVATPGEGVAYKQIFDPLFWGNVTREMTVGDLIQVIPENQTYFAELLVRDCGSTWAKVQELRYIDLDKVEVVGDEGANGKYAAEYRGLRTRWCVVQTADKSIVVDKLGTKSEALAWINANARAFAA